MGKRTYAAALVVCALAFAAVMASGAAAATSVETENTMYTCRENPPVPTGVNRFSDADCSEVENSAGRFRHVSVAENTLTELALSNDIGFHFKVKIINVNVTLGAIGVSCVGCTGKNQKDATTGKMDVTGTGGQVKFTGVTTNVTNCGVEGGSIETKPLKFTTLSPTKDTLEPVGGVVMAEFNFVNSGGTCPLVLSNPVKVEGHVDAETSGAFATFNSVAGMLNVGSQTGFLTGRATVSGRMGSAEAFTPLSITN